MKKVFPGVLILIMLLLTACDANRIPEAIGTPASVPAEYAGLTNSLGPDAAVAGAEVFHANCEPCHGTQGHGDGPAASALDPAPKDLAELQEIVGDDYLFWRINTGKPGTSMIAWEGVLSEDQIWQLVTFIRTLK